MNTLDHIERPEGSIYLKNTIIERIRKHKIPSLDQNGKRLFHFGVKWDASSRWFSSLYCFMRNLGQMTIRKMYPTVPNSNSKLESRHTCFFLITKKDLYVDKIITRCRRRFGVGVRMIPYGQSGAGSMPAPGKPFT